MPNDVASIEREQHVEAFVVSLMETKSAATVSNRYRPRCNSCSSGSSTRARSPVTDGDQMPRPIVPRQPVLVLSRRRHEPAGEVVAKERDVSFALDSDRQGIGVQAGVAGDRHS